MRIPTYTESLFGISLVFLCFYLAAFNHELLGKEEICSVDLLKKNEGKCLVSPKGTSKIRLIVKFGGDINTVMTKVPVSISINSKNYNNSENDIYQKSASTGEGRRYYRTLNYGDFDILENEEAEILIKAGAGVETLRLFKATIVSSPVRMYIYLFGGLFLLSLFLSIFFRKVIFLKKYGKPVPYILYFFVVLLTLTWEI